jgi:hypothetical protein
MASAAEPRELALLSKAARALSQAKSLDEVLGIRDRAEAARVYVQAAKLGTSLYNDAAELKLRAERKAGEFLAVTVTAGNPQLLHDATIVSLAELGVEKTQSHRWQQIASVPEKDFDAHLEVTRDAGKEITTASVLRLARGESPERDNWTIGDVLRALTAAAHRIFDKCPEQDRETMAYKLRALGDEILENGDLGT